jgi:uncharacterized surface protein with fasciclin (FAS1) repeats
MFWQATAALAALPLAGRAQAQQGNLWQVISAAPQAVRFVQLARMAGAESDMAHDRPISCFIPSNGALERMSAFRLAEIMRDQGQARRLVQNHLTTWAQPVNLATATQMGTDTFRSVSGLALALDYGSGALPRINGQPIIFANVRAGNGYVHVIDGVLEG